MKKLFSVFFFSLLFSFNVYAGSIPEDLLHSDTAQVFFGEIISLNSEIVEVIPVKKIKGDIITGTKLMYNNPDAMGTFNPKIGKTYLFTYFDENNPTCIFETTSLDTKTLKLKNTTGDMWERFEKNLNNGKYEKAELKRIDNINLQLEVIGNKITLLEFLNLDKEKIKRIDDVDFAFDSFNEIIEVDKDDFIKVAKKITITDVENTQMTESGFPKGGIYITVSFENDDSLSVLTPVYAYISNACQVDKYSLFMSRLPITDYIINADDFMKLINLTYDEKDYDNILYFVVIAVIFAVFASAYIRKRKNNEK